MAGASPILLCGFPAGSEDLASARIRYYTLTRELGARGVTLHDQYTPLATHLFIQKRITPELVELARRARSLGQCVIYDIDDFGIAVERLAPPKLFAALLPLCDLITVSTPGQRARLKALHRGAAVHVLPNSLDYGATGCLPAANLAPSPFRIMWFGYAHNTRLLEKYLGQLAELQDAQLVVVTRLDLQLPELLLEHPQVELVAWSRATFSNILRSCHASCLMHDGTPEDLVKSNVRMITSIAWGVPAVVSRTPDYAATAHKMGLADYLFDGPEDVCRPLERLRSPAARQHYLAAAQPVAWSDHAPAVIAERFLTLIRSARPARRR